MVRHAIIPRALAALAAAVSVVGSALNFGIAEIPAGWALAEDLVPDESTVGTFTLAMAMQNAAQLDALLLAVSTPGSPQYGQFMDETQIAATFGPSAESVAAVTGWLQANGITQFTIDGTYLDFNASIPTMNALLNASYQFYTSNEVTKLRTPSYTLPAEVASHVALVEPGSYFGSTKATYPLIWPNPKLQKRQDGATNASTNASALCKPWVTPACLKALYNIGDYVPDPASGSRISFGSWLGQSAIYEDLSGFETYYDIPQQNFSKVIIANGTNNQDISADKFSEANLDLQVIIGLTHPMPVVEYLTGGSPAFVPDYDGNYQSQNEPYLPFYRYMLSLPKTDLPQVISQSYADFEYTVPYNYAHHTCMQAGLLGLRGVSVLAGSGDWGVGLGCLLPDNTTLSFEAIYPATCPYITSVGGTVGVAPEAAWNGSSGGFSKYFSRPAWQDAAVAAYMPTMSNDTLAYYGQYTNFSGRGFPDIAAHSASPNYRIYAGHQLAKSGGTSAAAPVVASIVALVNDARFRAGKNTSLGWLNPLIYAHPELFTDITSGYSVGCYGYNAQTPSTVMRPGFGVIPGARWNATVGWDTTTGWGTPDFVKLRDLALTF